MKLGKFLRAGFLTAAGFSFACDTSEAPPEKAKVEAAPPVPVKPDINESEESFYNRHMALLAIKAQEPPYNMPPNVFFVTKKDIDRIAKEIREVQKKSFRKETDWFAETIAEDPTQKGTLYAELIREEQLFKKRLELEKLVTKRSLGFIKFLLRKSGYGSKPVDIETVLPKKALEGKTPKQVQKIKDFFSIFSSGGSMEEKMIKEILAHVNSNMPAAMAAPSGGFMDRLSPEKIMRSAFDLGFGSVLAGAEEPQSVAEVLESSTGLDANKLHLDLMRLNYINPFFNFHEIGHHIMGPRDELAEQWGAIRYLQVNPDKRGVLLMWRDFRALHNIVGDEGVVLGYRYTPQSLDYALSLSSAEIAVMQSEEIKIRASVGHAPDEKIEGYFFDFDKILNADGKKFWRDPFSSLNMDMVNDQMRKGVSGLSGIFEMRAAVFNKYLQIQKEKGEKASSLVTAMRERNRAILEFCVAVEGGEKLEDMFKKMSKRKPKMTSDIDWDSLSSAPMDPEILRISLLGVQTRYKPGQQEHVMLTQAIAALNNWKNPVRAYNLTPNYESKSESEISVLELRR